MSRPYALTLRVYDTKEKTMVFIANADQPMMTELPKMGHAIIDIETKLNKSFKGRGLNFAFSLQRID